MAWLIFKEEVLKSEIHLDELPSSFRKATLNMALAYTVCNKALKSLPGLNTENVSFVIATHFGEVQSTLDFLSIYSETGVPSPILFQNSLHNSTLGFVAIQLALTGPAMTISLAVQTESSMKLLVDSLVDLSGAVIICFVDCLPDQLQQHYLEIFPFLQNTLNKAIAYAFINAELKDRLKLNPIPFEKFF